MVYGSGVTMSPTAVKSEDTVSQLKTALRLHDDARVAELAKGATTGYSFVSRSPSANDPHPIPIYIGHGNKDKIISWKVHDQLFKTVEALRPGYPIKFVVFDGGFHGTPMRMTDWRLVLNWMLEVDGA